MMDPDLANRLRRFGEQVDRVAIAAQTQRATEDAPNDDTGALPPVVPITAARRNRRFHMVTAAAAAAIVVVGGALVTWRIVGESDSRPTDSTQVTVNTTGRPTTTETTTTTSTVVPTTTVPVIPLGRPSSTSSTTTSTTTSAPATGPGGNPSAMTGPCPNGYDAYGTSYPIRMCDEGPAVRLIQQYVGAPDSDGFFGPATRQSVRVFQEVHGLNVDGLVGPDTWAAMFPNGAPGVDGDGNGTVEPWETS